MVRLGEKLSAFPEATLTFADSEQEAARPGADVVKLPGEFWNALRSRLPNISSVEIINVDMWTKAVEDPWKDVLSFNWSNFANLNSVILDISHLAPLTDRFQSIFFWTTPHRR